MNRHLIFLYGTLKSGEPNHDKLQSLDHPKFIGNGATVDPFPLVIASKFNIPYLLDQVGDGKRIRGEIYEVDNAGLAILDEFEGHPDYYERIIVQVEVFKSDQQKTAEESDKDVIECNTYILRDFHTKLLTLPMHETYSSAGDHGLSYAVHKDESAEEIYSTKNDVKKTAA